MAASTTTPTSQMILGPDVSPETTVKLDGLPTPLEQPDLLYTAFSFRKITFIVFMAAFAGLISPLSATIYFPALNVLANDLDISPSAINLTLLTYMIWQGLAPVLLGDLADTIGRRPVFIAGFVVYIVANVGLALQNSFGALLALRMVQSAGTSSTVAIAAGVAADISPSSTRGKYMGWVTCGTAMGTAVGPVLGGILSQYLGWRSIFWFLAILLGIYMVPLVLAFPETGRNVVGNGSIPPQTWNMSLLSYHTRRRIQTISASDAPRENAAHGQEEIERIKKERKLRMPNPWKSIQLIFCKDSGLLLLYNAIVYSAFNTIIASTPYLFGEIYGFDDLQIGLCYLPFGLASFLAPLINGRLVDWNFRRVAEKLGIAIEKGKAQKNIHEFPLERARIPVALPQAFVGVASLVAYGWVIQFNGSLTAALVLQFIIGLSVTGCFQVMNLMIVDYHPQSPSTATAANNLCRCWLGGATGALIIIMIEKMGRGWCFTFVAFVLLIATSILVVLLRNGPKWRRTRMDTTTS
ncbi:major facilitator superfamily domain-containing protein [Acrodontium crateriforme]|uniref:Major facilitator superfamily domain-containing protein n=1 Tax=Acrodontium crateriforme TaxID=150365 RepID=A0AAQ3RC62_9PEZI|nr:major facilitator superfamily domain-containing protein [Acrodontium crateriforme]